MFKKVLWATDGSNAADQALAVARRIAAESEGELLAVHCVELTMAGKAGGRYPIYANEDELEAKINGQVAELSSDGIPARAQMTRCSVGEAAHRIAEVTREENGDVIVVGTRGRGPMAGLLLGSVTQRLLHLASCPVLAVPTKAADSSA